MSSLELKVPPLLLFGAVALVMALLARWLPAWDFTLPASSAAAAVLAAAGAGVAALGARAFVRARTTLDPRLPHKSSSLVRGGVYRASRNPMYLGMLLLLAAWGLQLGNLAALLGLPAFVLYMNRFQITPEERLLGEKFGLEFDQYRAAVRRWL